MEGNRVGIPALNWGKMPRPPPMGMGTRMGIEINPRAGMGTRKAINFHPHPLLFLASRDIPFPFPFPAFPIPPRFFFLDFNWIILCNLCIVKLVLHGLVKF